MATIDELEARATEIAQAEAAALYALAEGMRELAVVLPDGSSLAIKLVEEARKVEQASSWKEPGAWVALTIRTFVANLMRERQE